MKKTIVMVMLLGVMLLGLANAATISDPTTGEEICGTFGFDFTTTGFSHVTNVTLVRSLANGSAPWTHLASVANTSANQTSWTINYATTGLTDAIGYVFNVTVAALSNGSVYPGESKTVTGINVDNTGPVLSFASDNTKDKDIVNSEDFQISITSDENLASAPVVDFNGQLFTLTGSAATWSYDFIANDLRDDTYVYTISGTDNTTCGSTSASKLRREVTIYSKGSVAVKQTAIEEQEAAEQAAEQNNVVVIALIVLAAYLVFFKGDKKGRKK